MKYLSTIVLIILVSSIANAKEIKTEILINASPEKVWAIFSDFENYPTWNPFIKSLTGQVKVGDKVHVTIQPYDSKPMSFKPKILHLKPRKKFDGWGVCFLEGSLMANINLNLSTMATAQLRLNKANYSKGY